MHPLKYLLLSAIFLPACDARDVAVPLAGPVERAGDTVDTGAGDTGAETGETGNCGSDVVPWPPKACSCDPEEPQCGPGTDCIPTTDVEVPHACLAAWSHDCIDPEDPLRLLPPLKPFGWDGKQFCPICLACESSESPVLQCSPW